MKRLAVILVLTITVLGLLSGCGKSRVSRAEELLSMGSKAEAVKLLGEEISDNPKNADAYFVYGKALLDDDRQGAYVRFRSAIKADEGMKYKVCELLKKDATYSDLAFINDLDPKIINDDANLCYQYNVEKASGPYTAVTFADAFPKDPRAPKAIAIEAAAYKESGSLDSAKAKRLYQRIVNDYPQSSEAQKARELLADWWIKQTISLPVDHRWHPCSVKKGQRYRYRIRGEITKETGLGLTRFNSDSVYVFVGTGAELADAQRHTISLGDYLYGYNGPEAQKANGFGSGVAPKDCDVSFTIESGIEVNGNLDVDFEVKE